jgi:hypothetical protein
LLLAACSSSPAPTSSVTATPTGGASTGTSAVEQAGGPATSVTATTASPELIKVFRSAGFDAGTAYVASRTISSVVVQDGHTIVVTHHLPNGAKAEITYHLYAGGAATPSAAPTATATLGTDTYQFQVRYAIAAATLPAALLAQIDAGLPTTAPASFAGSATGMHVQLAALRTDNPPSTIDVVVSGVISQTQESTVDGFVALAGNDTASASWDVWKSGGKVWDAIGANDLITTATAKLDALKKCAENPTSKVAQNQYANDPAAKDKATATIDEVRSDIQQSAVALFGGLLLDSASSLVKAAPWLGFVITPGLASAQANLTAMINERMRAAEAAVTPCHYGYTAQGSAGQVPIYGTVADIDKTFTLQVTPPGGHSEVTLVGGSAGGSITGTGSIQGLVEHSTGTYHMTKTDTGYEATGTVTTCLNMPGHTVCSPSGEFHVTFTPQQ